MTEPESQNSFEYIEQWRLYINGLNSPRLKPTPNLLQPRPITIDEWEEEKALIDYELQISQPAPTNR